MYGYHEKMNIEASLEQSYTFRLFKRMPSFLGGFAALIDLSPSEKKYNYDATVDEADLSALQSDWCAIGDDLYRAIKDYERERKEAATS
jgi:hypothetical protein